MTKTALRRVLAVVALLAAGYGAAVWIGGDGGDGTPTGPVPEALRRAATARLDSVRIVAIGDSILLHRDGETWYVDGHRADSGRVASLRRTLGNETGLELASRNAANHARMGVDSAGARRVILQPSEGNPIRLWVGDRGPYASSVYARVPGTTPVHLVRGELGRLVRGSPEDWRDRTVASVDTGRVSAVVVRRPDTTYRLHRASGGWRVGDASADSAAVGDLLGVLSGLESSGFAADTATVAPPDREVVALGGSEADTLVHLRLRRASEEGPGPARYLVSAADRKGVFEVPGARVERLSPSAAELRTRPGGGKGSEGS